MMFTKLETYTTFSNSTDSFSTFSVPSLSIPTELHNTDLMVEDLSELIPYIQSKFLFHVCQKKLVAFDFHEVQSR